MAVVRLLAAVILCVPVPAVATPPDSGPPTAVVRDGVVLIGPETVVPEPGTGLRRVRLDLRPWRTGGGGQGGNHGDLYDNRDRGHSLFRPARDSGMSTTAYTAAAQAIGLDYGVNPGLVFGTITIGNSSTAITRGPRWRSLGRALLTEPGGSAMLAALYGSNHLYVYPEHRDHDPERGDLLPAATPHFVLSQGSSGSDRPFLKALAAALAALRPDTKTALREAGLVAPALQMLLRRSMSGVDDDARYMSGAAHPSAFDGTAIETERLVQRAAALMPDALPPRVRLRVTEEPESTGFVFADGLDERLHDTPDSIARVARGTGRLRQYRIMASAAGAAPDRPLRFHWRVLRGRDVTLTPLDPAGQEATVTVGFHAPYAVPDGAGAGHADAGLQTYRIDVGVFAESGGVLSAPAFFSVAFPPTEVRRHDGAGRPVEIAYDPPETADLYADPALFPWRGWRDVYRYAPDGTPLGWDRTHADGRTEVFTGEGLRVIETDALGRPVLGEVVAYRRQPAAGRERVVPVGTGALFHKAYAGPQDLTGHLQPVFGLGLGPGGSIGRP